MADQKLSKEQRAAIVRDFEMALRAALAEADQQTAVISKHMFGGAGFYGDGEFFAAWFGDDSLHLKLSEADRIALAKLTGVNHKPEDGQYILLSRTWLDDPQRSGEWIAKSVQYAHSLSKGKGKRRAK